MLDKVSGQSSNYDLASGSKMEIGQLTVALRACRYPEGAPSNDAFAYIEVSETDRQCRVDFWRLDDRIIAGFECDGTLAL